jgi:hypothetical protein
MTECLETDRFALDYAERPDFYPKSLSRAAQAASHRRQASAQILQCSCMLA